MSDTVKDNIKDKDTGTYDPRRRREIIKTILIIFLAVLLVLTFFSNTIMNKSLAEISTERATSGKLTERIRENGTVSSDQSYEVKVDSNLVIDTVMIKEGKEVQKDDVLFTVSGDESEELIAAQKELDDLQMEYRKEQLKLGEDFADQNKAVNDARAALNTAIAKRDAAIRNQGSVAANKNTLKNLKSELSRYEKLQEKLQATITAIDSDSPSQAAPEYSTDLINLKQAATNAEKAYNNAFALYTAMLSGKRSGGMDGDIDDAGSADVPDVVTPEALEAAKADSESKKAAWEQAQSAYDNYCRDFRSQLIQQLSGCETSIESLNDQISGFEESGAASEGESIEALNENVASCQEALNSAVDALNKAKSENSNQSKLDAIDMEAKQKAIDQAQAKVDKLRSKTAVTEIRSKYSGVVSSVSIKPGETAIPDTPLAVIDLSEEGYTVQITVDAEKTKKIKKGVEAEVMNSWGNSIQAVLTDIKSDPTAGKNKRVLVFSVTGDVKSGTFLDLSIPCGSGSYDCIVPKSALGHDNDGDFVLTVVSRSSPLGNRYYAERVGVTILSSDENSSAVQGNIGSGEYVITAASKHVAPKDQVRMKDK